MKQRADNRSGKNKALPVTAVVVAADIPVVWIIEADAAALNGCNNELVLPAFDRQVRLTEGRNTITFTPEEPGEYLYSCWMGMLRNTITVVPQETGTGILF